MTIERPQSKPQNPCFSSGPTTKHPGWSLKALEDMPAGRSHRSAIGVEKLKDVIDRSKAILGMPSDWRLAIVPASDTGAVEMALWSLLGPRGVDVLGWETFSNHWVVDVTKQLKLDDVRVFQADFGKLPDLSAVDTDRDVVFAWNGTTGGVKVPNDDWIKKDRKGLTICDATSAAFAMDLPWDKLDVVTWSWQKVLGSEAAHGMLALSPRAVERLENHKPDWPMPKIFRMTKDGKINEDLFKGKTINTPSMLAVEDCLDALKWVQSIGGLPEMLARSQRNLDVVSEWIARTDWAEFLCEDKTNLSCTSLCFKVVDPWFNELGEDARKKAIKDCEKLLATEGVAYEVANHRDAPASFRIWGGGTVEASDIKAVLDWIDWAYRSVTTEMREKAA